MNNKKYVYVVLSISKLPQTSNSEIHHKDIAGIHTSFKKASIQKETYNMILKKKKTNKIICVIEKVPLNHPNYFIEKHEKELPKESLR